MKLARWTLVVALSVLAAQATTGIVYDLPKGEEKWWQNAIIYQIYPRSFKDSDGDGIGDLKGIISKLDYLKEIGVTGVWLSPIYKSPQKDFGYDISDFQSVDPTYGTLDDLDQLIKKAHELGMKVILDFVPNHTSNEHEWFKKSEESDADYKDFYIWQDGIKDSTSTDPNAKPKVPNNWVSHFRGSAWEWSEKRQQYYLHQFAKEQPDLNYRNEKVVNAIDEVLQFWMKRGVDGFRMDAVPFLFEAKELTDEPKAQSTGTYTTEDYEYYDHPYTHDLDETYEQIKHWRTLVDSYQDGTEKKDLLIMTESYTTLEKTFEYYGTDAATPGATFTFNFEAITTLSAQSNAADFKNTIDSWLTGMKDWRWPNWVIGNHDNKRVGTRYPDLEDALNILSLTLPGTAVTYYGEELGMTDAFITWKQTKDPQALSHDEKTYLQFSRDPCRTPLQWDDTTSAGFSTNAKTWLPVNPDYWYKNVKAQQSMIDGASHLHIYKALAKARQQETIKKGTTTTDIINEDVLKVVRSLDKSDTYITLVNFGSYEQTLKPSDILPNQDLYVYIASLNAGLKSGPLTDTLSLRPKAGLVLTTAKVDVETTPAPPKPTPKPDQPTPKPDQPTPKPDQPTPKPPDQHTSSSSTFTSSVGSLVGSLLLIRMMRP